MRIKGKHHIYPLSDQYVFAKVMRMRPDLCKRIVERVLARSVAQMTLVQVEHESPSVTHRGVRFDVLLEGDNEVIEVEMQSYNDAHLPKRLRFYHSHLDRLMLDKGETFDRLNPACVIFICLNDPFRAGHPMYTFKMACIEDPAVNFEDEATSIVVCAHNFKKEDDGELATLMRYIATESIDSEDRLTLELSEAVNAAYADEEWVATMLTLEQEIDYRSRMAAQEAAQEEKESINKRYSALMAKMRDQGIESDEFMELMRENSLDELFERFGIV